MSEEQLSPMFHPIPAASGGRASPALLMPGQKWNAPNPLTKTQPHMPTACPPRDGMGGYKCVRAGLLGGVADPGGAQRTWPTAFPHVVYRGDLRTSPRMQTGSSHAAPQAHAPREAWGVWLTALAVGHPSATTSTLQNRPVVPRGSDPVAPALRRSGHTEGGSRDRAGGSSGVDRAQSTRGCGCPVRAGPLSRRTPKGDFGVKANQTAGAGQKPLPVDRAWGPLKVGPGSGLRLTFQNIPCINIPGNWTAPPQGRSRCAPSVHAHASTG